MLSIRPRALTNVRRSRLGFLLAFAAGAAVLVYAWRHAPLLPMLDTLLRRLEELGAPGLIIMGLIYVIAAILLTPAWILTASTGFLAAAVFPENPVLAVASGAAVASLASLTGASAAFWLARKALRRRIEPQDAPQTDYLRRLDAAVRERGFPLVLLLRLSPAVPFNLLNYTLGFTSVRPAVYVAATWLGTLPGTLAYTYIGTALQTLTAAAAGAPAPAANRFLFWAGLAVTGVLAAYIAYIARAALSKDEAHGREVTPPTSIRKPDQPGHS